MNSKQDPNAIINPSSGLFARNPTHIEHTKYADNQNDIVKAIKESGVKKMTLKHTYTPETMKDPLPLSGITKIRDMEEEAIVSFSKNIMRVRPNIFYVHIKLGDYPDAKIIDNTKTRALNAHKPRMHTEVGEIIGNVLADKNLNVVELKYMVNNSNPGTFNVISEVVGTTTENYENDEFFLPSIEIQYIKTT